MKRLRSKKFFFLLKILEMPMENSLRPRSYFAWDSLRLCLSPWHSYFWYLFHSQNCPMLDDKLYSHQLKTLTEVFNIHLMAQSLFGFFPLSEIPLYLHGLPFHIKTIKDDFLRENKSGEPISLSVFPLFL